MSILIYSFSLIFVSLEQNSLFVNTVWVISWDPILWVRTALPVANKAFLNLVFFARALKALSNRSWYSSESLYNTGKLWNRKKNCWRLVKNACWCANCSSLYAGDNLAEGKAKCRQRAYRQAQEQVQYLDLWGWPPGRQDQRCDRNSNGFKRCTLHRPAVWSHT